MKLTFDEALERINDQVPVHAADVQSRALQRRVWVAEWHLPGCLSESTSVCLTKRDAIDCALSHFILQTNEERARILAEAQRNPKVSGALIHCYKWALTA